VTVPAAVDKEDQRSTVYYFSASECALVQIGTVLEGALTGINSNRSESQLYLPTMYWVADMDAILPMYPEDEVTRFVYLEVGYMLAIVREQINAVSEELYGGLDIQWVTDQDLLSNWVPGEGLVEAGLSLLPESARCLAVGQLADLSQRNPKTCLTC